MTWQVLTFAVWGMIATAVLVCEVLGVAGPAGWPTFGDIFDWMLHARAGRWFLAVGWLWLGWHLFVR